MTVKVAVVVLLLSTIALAIFAGCGGMAGDAPAPAANPASEPPPAVTTAVAQAEATVMASYAKSSAAYCGRLCQPSFWLNATVADLDAEISKGAAVNTKEGFTGGGSPLHHAVQYADLSVITALLDRGANVDAKIDRGLTALHTTAWSGTHHTPIWDVAALLLDRGADANAQDDRLGYSALHYTNDPIMAVILLNYGADVNQKSNDGSTPLHTAAGDGPAGFLVNGDIALVTLLLEHGADINAVNDYGQTPLLAAVIHAARYGATADAVALLLEHGADINAKDADGKTACQSLVGYSSSDIDEIRELVCP